MSRGKIARKSTWVDMTAFVDVGFLLLAFFILTTKFKTPEAMAVVTPSSVSSKEAAAEDQCLVTIGPDGRIFISFTEDVRRIEIVDDLNKRLGLTLTEQEVQLAGKAEFFGTPLNQLKSFLNMDPEVRKGGAMPGIPVMDSTNNEMEHWIQSVNTVFLGKKLNLMVKGDKEVGYPAFKGVIDAFKKHDQNKFKIVTSQQTVPSGTWLADEIRKGVTAADQ